MRTKSMKVKCVDNDPIRYQEAADIVSLRVQQFYDENHFEFQEHESERESEHESANAEECVAEGGDSDGDASPHFDRASANESA